jgi:geranylgeranyl pyrophosphate synthase
MFRIGAAGGAAAGTADDTLIEALGDYGNALGVIMQLLDDCRDLLDQKTDRFEVSLPILLYSLAIGSEKVIFPATGSSEETISCLQRAHVPEMIATLIQEWQKNALKSLEPLNGSKTMDALITMIPDASRLPF